MLFRSIDEFEEIVFSARPSPNTVNDPYYERQKEAYRELLRTALALISQMTETLNQVFAEYRIFIQDLWEAISNGRDSAPIVDHFQQRVQDYLKQSWDPIFARANQMVQDIEQLKQNS
ncbi:unnamed protein product [Rotaria sp. Silwood1]